VRSSAEARDVPPLQMLRTPIFWLMFAMMTMMSTSGLMVISQMATFARDFGVAQVTVWGLAALPLALTLDRLTNGLTRPFFGWVSDRIGREHTMTIAFALEGLAWRRGCSRATMLCSSSCCPAWYSSAGEKSSRCSRPP
jgi:MFS family permease